MSDDDISYGEQAEWEGLIDEDEELPVIVPATSIDWSRDDDWTDEEDDVDDSRTRNETEEDVDDYEDDPDSPTYEGDGTDSDWGV